MSTLHKQRLTKVEMSWASFSFGVIDRHGDLFTSLPCLRKLTFVVTETLLSLLGSSSTGQVLS